MNLLIVELSLGIKAHKRNNANPGKGPGAVNAQRFSFKRQEKTTQRRQHKNTIVRKNIVS